MIVASIVGVNLFTAALVTIVTLVAAGCLKTKHIYPALNLPVLIVIAAAFGVSQAMQNSGAAGVCACVRACMQESMHASVRVCMSAGLRRRAEHLITLLVLLDELYKSGRHLDEERWHGGLDP